MRLLETTDGRTYRLTHAFIHKDHIPAYAILSHTWETDQEITFDDITEDGKSKYRKLRASLRLTPRSGKGGYDKLRFCARQARRDGLRYFWVDTCCINKSDPQELDRAINSMFQWYKHAAKCYVYLSDVSTAHGNEDGQSPTWQPAFAKSRWFSRGWTLQELLAPPVVEFYSREGVRLGSRLELRQTIHEITDIPPAALSGTPLSEFSVDERLSWAVERQTAREEDEVYALLGIFDIKLPFIYTEGYDKALRRLLNKINESNTATVDQGSHANRMARSTVPFRRDEDFICRESLVAIRHMCVEPAGCAALVGLGGVGKSQIAIEYAHQILDDSSDTWVFWVHAETKERLREGFLQIAQKTMMTDWNDPKADVVQLVNSWLSNEANGRWVMVIDSADDANVFLHDPSSSCGTSKTGAPETERSFSFVLPRSSIGSILITSRNREVACMLTGSETSIVEVGPMDDQDAFALLRKKFSFPLKRQEADALVSALDHMPLALTQAAAFINRTPRMSISRYLDEIGRDRARFLDSDLLDIRRDAAASSSITKTWQISFDYVCKRSPNAARLLSLMSLFNRQGIPKSLLEGRYAGHEHGDSEFEYDVYMLISFCFVKLGADDSSFEMHGLVQLSTRKWLELNGELEYWKEVYVGLVNESFPDGRPENWAVCETLFPHAQAALNNHPLDADALEAWASISWKAAWYMGQRGESSIAYKLALDSLEVREILLSSEDPEIADSLNTVGVTLSRLGRYEEAKTMYQRAVEAQERILGADHLDTLTTMLNLAQLLGSQGHWTDAGRLLQQILAVVSKNESEAGRSLTLSSLTTLATVHSSLGRYREAADLERRILEARESKIGAEHPTTLTVKANLAYTYRHLGRLKEAEELNLQILEAQEANQQAETEILVTKAHLASIYLAQGRWSLAESLQLEVLATTQSKLGPEHPDTFYAMGNLAGTYWTQGRLHEALALQQQLLELRGALLGDNHPATLDTKESLAATYWSLSHYAESEALTLSVLKIRTATVGASHPLTLNSKACLASAHRDQGRFEEAQRIEEEVLEARKEGLGHDHPATLGSMGNLAVTLHRQGFVERAFELMEECYSGHVRVLGEQHPLTERYKEGLERWRRGCAGDVHGATCECRDVDGSVGGK